MYEDLKELLANKHPVRLESMLTIVEYLCEVGYEDTILEQVQYAIAIDDGTGKVGEELEDFIFKCAKSLLDKLGVSYDPDILYNRPRHLGHIISALLFDIEQWDDWDTLLAIVDSGEPGGIMLGNVISQFTTEPASAYYEIILDISPMTYRAIRGALVANELRELDDTRVNLAIVANIIKFIEQYPHSPVIPLVSNYGFLRPFNELITCCVVPYDPLRPEEYVNAVGIATAGLLLTRYETYEEAYKSDIAKVVEQVIDPARRTKIIPAVGIANTVLKRLYEESNDESS